MLFRLLFPLLAGFIFLVQNNSFCQPNLIVWANEGCDKVAKEELRASRPGIRKVMSRVWDGTTIKIFGGKNEIVNFNLVIESPDQATDSVSVSFNRLTGPGGASLLSIPASGDGVFNWVNRPIELFYIRYLQIRGLSRGAYENYYDERHVPERLRRPWTGRGVANPGATWQDRPDHDLFYPDIAVPLELVPVFSIAFGTNQGVWADIYIPKNALPGLYNGQVTIRERGVVTHTIPVELTVFNFTLPDMPGAKTMLAFSAGNVNERHLGRSWISGADEARAKLIQDRHFLLAHRHKISLIGDDSYINSDYTTGDHPSVSMTARLSGNFFTTANGYDGPGAGTGNNVYSVGTYGGWRGSWFASAADSTDSISHVRTHSDAWVNWFNANAPGTEYFLYLIDESSDYPQTERWAQWLHNNPGPGRGLMSMATLPLPAAVANTPTLQIVASVAGIGITDAWETAAVQYTQDPYHRFFLYNGGRPAAGCFATEDDGVALRVNAWIQYKKRVQRWFYWEATYYDDFQGGSGKMDLFSSAHTFGSFSSTDPVQGETGWNYSNGDGVLLYPGTDSLFPASSYGVNGPFASLRMKLWRRGLQDYDYLALAAVNHAQEVQHIVDSMIPRVVWEVGVDELADPTYVHTDISWSTDPDVWENARYRLAALLDSSLAKTQASVVKASSACLSANPNPGSLSIRIAWTLPALEKRVKSLKIFDVTGRLVKSFAAGCLNNGKTEWNGLDDTGNQAAAGPYWIRLEGQKTVRTRQVVLQ